MDVYVGWDLCLIVSSFRVPFGLLRVESEAERSLLVKGWNGPCVPGLPFHRIRLLFSDWRCVASSMQSTEIKADLFVSLLRPSSLCTSARAAAAVVVAISRGMVMVGPGCLHAMSGSWIHPSHGCTVSFWMVGLSALFHVQPHQLDNKTCASTKCAGGGSTRAKASPWPCRRSLCRTCCVADGRRRRGARGRKEATGTPEPWPKPGLDRGACSSCG